MSYFTALQQHIPKGVKDTLKLGVSNLNLSNIASVLLDIKTIMVNSSQKGLALGQTFADHPELISDNILVPLLKANEDYAAYFTEQAEITLFRQFIDEFNAWFDAMEPVDYEWQGATRSAIELTNANGNMFLLCRIVCNENSAIFRWIHSESATSNFEDFIFSIDGTHYFHNTASDIYGNVMSFWDLLKDQLENSTLCSTISEAATLIVNTITSQGTNVLTAVQDAGDKYSTIPAMAKLWMENKYLSVRTFGEIILRGFSQGGVYGACRAVIDYVLAARSTSVDDDGNLSFTDNSALVPQVYLAGIISAATTIAATAASIIVAIFSRVAGAAVAIIGSLATSIIQAISYDYNTYTLPSLVDGFNVPYSVAPYGLFATTYFIDIRDHISDWMLANGKWMSYCPGGVMFYTLTQESETLGRLMIEFHPDLIDRIGALPPNFIAEDDLNNNPWIKVSNINLNPASIQYYIDHHASTTHELQNNYNSTTNDYVLSTNDSVLVGKIICYNVLIFLLYYYSHDADANHERYWIYFDSLQDNLDVSVNGTTSSLYQSNRTAGSTSDSYVAKLLKAMWYCYLYAYSNSTTVSQYYNILADIANDLNEPFTFQVNDNIIATSTDTSSDVSLQCLYRLKPSFINPNNSSESLSMYYGSPVQVPNNMSYALRVPKYNRSSFIAVIVGTIAITTIIAAATVAATVIGKKSITRKRAQLTAKAEKAWDNLKANPSDENYMAFRKAAKKNNMFVNLFGGNKIDLNSYWATGSSDPSTPGQVLNNLIATDSEGSISNAGLETTTDISFETIYKVIVG